METALIQMIDIKKSFNGNPVLNGVNLSIFQGQITTIIGKSGTGKSVLLRHIIGLLHQDAGELLLNGVSSGRMNHSSRHAFQKHMAYMFQDNALFDFLTVFENVALPLSEKRIKPLVIKERVGQQLFLLGLEGIDHQYPSQLSGGMRKRVAMARALITNPKIVLFDEPTTGLDPIRKNSVHSMIAHYQAQFGFTAIIVSHDIPDIFDISQHVAMLDKGKIIIQGKSDEVRHSQNPLVQSFIRGEDISSGETTHRIRKHQ
jgi:phospholipid/cholesterol/gamma-HCH transport system ATP-binding protein